MTSKGLACVSGYGSSSGPCTSTDHRRGAFPRGRLRVGPGGEGQAGRRQWGAQAPQAVPASGCKGSGTLRSAHLWPALRDSPSEEVAPRTGAGPEWSPDSQERHPGGEAKESVPRTWKLRQSGAKTWDGDNGVSQVRASPTSCCSGPVPACFQHPPAPRDTPSCSKSSPAGRDGQGQCLSLAAQRI